MSAALALVPAILAALAAAVCGLCCSNQACRAVSIRSAMGANGHSVSSRSRVMARMSMLTGTSVAG